MVHRLLGVIAAAAFAMAGAAPVAASRQVRSVVPAPASGTARAASHSSVWSRPRPTTAALSDCPRQL